MCHIWLPEIVQFEEQISTFAVQVMIERMAETFAKIVVPQW